MMNIVMREMKANLRSLIFWSVGMVLMVLISMGKYAAMPISGQAINEFVSQIPKALQVVMGVGVFDLSKASGFYGVLYQYLLLIATIHSVMLGASMIAKEELDKTAEFLFTKPVSRARVLRFKLVAAFLNLVILNGVTLLSSILICNQVAGDEDLTGDILILMGGLFILQVLFLSLGAVLAAISKNPKTAQAMATVVLLITFLLAIFIDLNAKLEPLQYFTPFKYFEAQDLLNGGDGDPIFVTISLVLSTIFIGATFWGYQRRDLHL